MPPPIPSFPRHAVPPAQKQPNWWLIGCGGCLSLIVLTMLAGVGIYYWVSTMIHSSEGYQMALTTATSSPEVQEALGTPIKTSWMQQCNIATNNINGIKTETAELSIPIKGPKASASLHFAGKKTGKEWEVSDFTVTVDGTGQKIFLHALEVEKADLK